MQELHTFSSLNETFLAEYDGAMNDADEAIVYYNPHTVEHKKLKPVSSEQVNKNSELCNIIFKRLNSVRENALKKT